MGVIKHGATTIVVNTIVRAGDSRVEIALDVDWREQGGQEKGVPNLRVRFPVAIKEKFLALSDGKKATYETPYGSVERDLFDGSEVPAMRWADLSDGDGGVTLLNDSKHGHSILKDTLRLTLIRSSYDPDPLPEQGQHRIRYALLPHGDDWGAGDSARAGRAFGQPLRVVATGVHGGPMPAVGSCISVEPDNVLLAVMKKAEGKDGLVIRLLETAGKETQAVVTLHDALGIKSAIPVDALERPVDGEVALEDGELRVKVRASSIGAVLLER